MQERHLIENWLNWLREQLIIHTFQKPQTQRPALLIESKCTGEAFVVLKGTDGFLWICDLLFIYWLSLGKQQGYLK